MRRSVLVTGFLCAAALAGCTQFPELEQTATPGVANAAYPALVPIETIIDGPLPRATPAVRAGVEARAAGLRARAAALQRARVGPLGNIDRRVARLRQRAAALRAQ